MAKFFQVPTRWRREARVLIERWLLPLLIALMPWWLGFRVARRLARWPWLFRERVEACVEGARRHGVLDDAARFAHEQRFYMIVDTADLYLLKLRSNRYLTRHFEVDGAWPAGTGPMIVLSCHWGAALWAMRHLRATGRVLAGVSVPIVREQFAGIESLYRYARLRTQACVDIATRPFVYIGQGPRPMLRNLAEGVTMVTSIDVPGVGGEVACRVLDREARLPAGMFKLAAKAGVPVVLYASWIDLRSGRRHLKIREAVAVGDRHAGVEQGAAHLDWMLRESAAAWHFWGHARAFFPEPGATDPSPSTTDPDDFAES